MMNRDAMLVKLRHLSGRFRHEFKETLFMLTYTACLIGFCWFMTKVAASHVVSGITGSIK
jgi:hypothetical protein